MTERASSGAQTPLNVLYFDTDSEALQQIQNHRDWKNLSVHTVGETSTALDTLEKAQFDVLVFDPAALISDDSTFVSAINDIDSTIAVVVYTDLDPSEIDQSLEAGVETVVEKGVMEESLGFLRDKVAATTTQTGVTGVGMLDSYEVLVEAARDGIYILDGDGRFQYANQSMADLVGYDQEALVGMHASQVMAPGELERGQALIQEMVTDGESESDVFDMQFQTRDGEKFMVGLNFSIIYNERTYAGIVGVARDVTDRIEDKAELKTQNKRLEEFASILSHDLRNPLNVAQGRLELAQTECDSEHLDAASEAVDRSLALIEDILTLAREGESASDLELVDLDDLADGCWSNIESGDATFNFELERAIRADPSRLKRLLENLFRNAVEHGGEGVTVTIGELADGFYVADDGPGIPTGKLNDVFETGYSTTDGGTGFGLNIVQNIVEAHKWSISITESADGGARFEISNVDMVD